MAVDFVDSSALVKRYVQEIGAPWLSSLLSHFGRGKALAFEATALAGVGTDMLALLDERVSARCPHGF